MQLPPGLGIVDPLFALARAPGASLDAAGSAVAALDRFGVARAGISVDADPALARTALASHPGRFFARSEADPRAGLAELRRLEALARELPLRLVTGSPALRGVPLDDARWYPLYAKCVELGLAFSPCVGVPAERVPYSPQTPERVDPVACFFAELRIVLRGDLGPWAPLAVWLMRRHPSLAYATAGVRPSELPAELLAFANEDGAHQLLFASEAPASPEPFYKELPELALARPVWRPFVRENSARILKLDAR